MSKRSREDSHIQMDNQLDIRRVIFFAFYIIFFIFVAVVFRGVYSINKSSKTRFNSGYKYSFRLNDINENNYHFIYKKQVNNNTTIYEGDRFNDVMEFTMSGVLASKYYVNNDTYYLKNPNTLEYLLSSNPMDFSILTKPSNLNQMFLSATYISFVEYIDSKAKDYNYDISTSSLLRLFNNIELDIDDSNNKIVAKVDEDGRLYEIDMDMTNYFKYFNSNILSYNLSFLYSKFGNIEKITMN